jgi:hypothetical protein
MISFISIISCQNSKKEEINSSTENVESLRKETEASTKKAALEKIENKEKTQNIKELEKVEITDVFDDKEDKNTVVAEVNSPSIKTINVEGIKVGDTYMDHSDKFKRADKEVSPENFKGYFIMDKNGNVIGFAFANPADKSKIMMIEITSSDYRTNEGIAIGSTFEEAKKAYPTIKIQESKVENTTSVTVGNYSFLLQNVANNTSKGDESKIKPLTKIKKITIR